MRTLNKFAFLSLLVTALVLSLFSGGGQMASAQGSIPDDELAYIDAGGFINIVDPVTPSGGTPFTWRSPTGGYTDMAALDVNGDGVDEIVAIAGGTVRLLVPFNTGGTPPQFSQTIPSGFQYVYVAAGDFVPGDGGRDEILVQRTDNRNNSTYSVQIYDGNADGASWQLVFDETFGVNWIRLVGGDVDGLEGDELIMIRNGTQQNRDKRLLIRKYAPND
ncbi:MAG TPA: VCBS repeat-containing protein, partial [Caldilineales bacterium]|nr:VCBS repeat-containing protein [Caldilineales bacterium]